jgi:hypothetical protein
MMVEIYKKTGNARKVVIEMLSYKYCCSAKPISITYSEFVFVFLVTQHAMRMRHIVTCALPSSKIFSHIIS